MKQDLPQVVKECYIKNVMSNMTENMVKFLKNKHENHHGLLRAIYKEGHTEYLPMNNLEVLTKALEYFQNRDTVESVGWFYVRDLKTVEIEEF